jgi:hypothetical protein
MWRHEADDAYRVEQTDHLQEAVRRAVSEAQRVK